MSRSSHPRLHAEDSQVLRALNSESFPSEPPDIRNWFSSYLYESPELNSVDGFLDLDGSKSASIEDDNKEKSGEILNEGKSEADFLIAGKQLSEEIVHRNEPDVCESSKSDAMDDHNIRPMTKPRVLNSFNLKSSGEQKKSPQEPGNADEAKRMGCCLIDRTNDNTFHEEYTKYNQDADSQSHKSSASNKSVEEGMGKENLNNVASSGIRDCSKSEPVANGSDGFVSTRKKTRRSNSVENNVIQKRGLQLFSNLVRVANKSIEALSYSCDDALGDTGEWQCPQKNKPNLGPPMKQVRLEQWVRRCAKNG
ncbi:uncharacterized protein LOC127241817 [Andrographis paniculata]|uniref:uncharacterized protein LOC127241817 n=1 Tax=Andrographis paniculata TaxID=175694 RepID=UPI0021E8398D|nr:uncharacterized protein LOC127241817 [Andrographis paniculata]